MGRMMGVGGGGFGGGGGGGEDLERVWGAAYRSKNIIAWFWKLDDLDAMLT